MPNLFRIFSFFILLASANLFASAINLPVRNFYKSEYGGAAQNWDVAQDSIGRIYFGNNNGLLAYDGQRWKLYFLPNFTAVRSLLYDNREGRIFVGGSSEFGFFYYDPELKVFKYNSLLNSFSTPAPSFSEIWHIHKRGDALFFQGDYFLFVFENGSVNSIPSPGRITFSTMIGDNLFVATEDGGIYHLSAGAFSLLPGIPELQGKRIMTILPWEEGNLLIGTSTDGIYVYDFKKVTPLAGDLSDFLKQNQLFAAAEKDGDYVFGTVNRGVVTLRNGDRLDFINNKTGLQNNTVLNAAFDRDGNLWLCLDNGIDYVMTRSESRSLLGGSGSIGTAYSALHADGNLFLGTNQGLFSAPWPRFSNLDEQSLVRRLQGQIWSISDSPHGVLVASDHGVYNFTGDTFVKIPGPHGAFKVLPFPGYQDLALVSGYDHFHIIRFVEGTWVEDGGIENTEGLRGNFIFDNHGYVWMADWQKGIYRLKINPNELKLEEKFLFDHSHGLPSDRNNSVALSQGEAFFSTEGGFYRPSVTTPDMAEPMKSLNDLFAVPPSGQLQNLSNNRFALFNERGIVTVTDSGVGNFSIREFTGPLIYKNLVPGFASATPIDNSTLLVATQDGFVEISEKIPASSTAGNPYVNSIFTNHDSLIYSAGFHPSEKLLEIPYAQNSLRFEFAYPRYSQSDAIAFSSFLENYDKDWSPLTAESSREYTRLGNGSYTLHIKVHDDATGKESETSFEFRILPPWYFSPWMKAFYILVGVGLLIIVVYFIRRKFEASKLAILQRKEQEMEQLRKLTEQEALQKDYQIASLKAESLEQEIQHKSKELSNTAMNLIRKNEILREIGDQINKITSSDPSELYNPVMKRQLAKLQATISDSLEKNDDLADFNRNFDIVYQDYTKALTTLHPNLTNSDIRLCCYIRMGLSSKEIAPLVNISFRSVEMARYRLRKKLNLSPEASLSSYLSSLSTSSK